MKMLVAVSMFAFAAITFPAQAQVFKCQEGGKTVFSDKPCSMDSRPVIPASPQPNALPAPDARSSKRSDLDKTRINAVTSIKLSASAINSSASAAKDAWKVTVYFKDKDDKMVWLSDVGDIRFAATVYEDRDGERGPVVGYGSGRTIEDMSHYFIIKISTRAQTRLLTEASIVLPDGRRFDGVDRMTFFPTL